MEYQIKDITGFEGKYQITSDGRVYSIISKMWLKPHIKENGYCQLRLFVSYDPKTKKKKYVHLYLHRLVAQAFIPNPENKPEINHLDGNKLNNYISNLEWCTRRENIHHAVRTKLWVKDRKLSEEELTPFLDDYIKGTQTLDELKQKYQYFPSSPEINRYLRDLAEKQGKLEAFLKIKNQRKHISAQLKKHLTSKPILQFDLKGNFIKEWPSQISAAKALGITQGNISNCCHDTNRTKGAGGFIWRFKFQKSPKNKPE